MKKELTFEQAKKKARKLLQNLKDRANNNPKIFCENYGQDKLLDFKMTLGDLHYTERCEVMEILYPISRFSPIQ